MTNNKFGSLIADVAKPFRVEIIDPVTEELIRDNSVVDPESGKFAGKAMFISVWAADSARARDYGKAKRKQLALRVKQSRNGKVEPDDALEENIALCAALTESWYLVDRVTGEPIDVPCTPENAADLYSSQGAGWIFIQPWTEANSAANFLPKPSNPSVDMPKQSSEAKDA